MCLPLQRERLFNRMKKLLHSSTALLLAPEGLSNVTTMGLTGKVAHVHKKDADGMLAIDAVTGQVLPEQHDRPDWADGLVLAQLAERHIFYAAKLGEEGYTAEMRNPDIYAFEDLGWLAMKTDPEASTEDLDAQGNIVDDAEYVRAADDEHRQTVIAAALGIDRETGDIENVLAEVEIASDQTRTAAELAALEEAQRDRFAATGTGE